jgi:tetratricopeptide (TPR) repeat protein
MKNFPALLWLFVSLLIFQNGTAQNSAIDSLQNQASMQADDTSKVNTLNLLCREMINEGMSNGRRYAEFALKLSETLGYKRGEAAAHYNLGRFYNLGENSSLALSEFLKGIQLNEILGNKKGIAQGYIMLAGIYFSMQDDNKAIEYFQKALAIVESLPDKSMLESIYLSMSSIYISQGKHDEGMRYCLKAKNEAVTKGDKHGEARVYSSIGRIWEGERNYEEALKSYKQSHDIFAQLGDKNGMANEALNTGQIYFLQQNYNDAIKWHQQAELSARETGSVSILPAIYQALAADYERTGRTEQALSYFKMYSAANDSLLTQGYSQKMNAMEAQFDMEKKESAIRNLVAQQEVSTSAIQKNPMSLILLGVIILLVIILIVYFIIAQQKISTLNQKVRVIEQQLQFVKNPFGKG